MPLENEQTWLTHRLKRLRMILRFATDPRIEDPLRELIGDAEVRLAALEGHSHACRQDREGGALNRS